MAKVTRVLNSVIFISYITTFCCYIVWYLCLYILSLWRSLFFTYISISSVQFSCSVMSDFATPWTAARQASLSITNFWSLLKLMSIEPVMPSTSHSLSSPSPPAFSFSQYQSLFQSVSSSHQVVKVLEFQLQHQSFQWIFRTDFL